MTKQQQIDELLKRERENLQAIADLRARHDKAIKALSDLAQGYGVRRSEGQKWEHAMQNLAGLKLAEIASMPLRVKP